MNDEPERRGPSLALKFLILFFAAILLNAITSRILIPGDGPHPTPRTGFRDEVNRLLAQDVLEQQVENERASLCANLNVSLIQFETSGTVRFQCGPYATAILEQRTKKATASLSQLPHILLRPIAFLIGPDLPLHRIHPIRFQNTEVWLAPNFEFARQEYRIMALYSLLLSIFILLAVYLIIRQNLSPLRKLSRAMRSFRNGQAKQLAPVLSRGDEVGELSRSFHRMAAHIDELMETKEQLLIDISHELRSPLARLRMDIENLEADETAKEPFLSAVREMDKLVTLLLDGARTKNPAENFCFELISVQELLMETKDELIARRNDRNQTLSLEFDATTDGVASFIDRRYFKIAISNIIDNAEKYGRAEDPRIIISLKRTKDCIQIGIRDFGVGIPAEAREKVFEPFFRLDKARTPGRSGLGLGLNLVQRIIQAHGWNVFVDSAQNGGTHVLIELPLDRIQKVTFSAGEVPQDR